MNQQPLLEEVMPLFAPKYDKKFFKNFAVLKDRIRDKDFSEDSNAKVEAMLKTESSNYNLWYIKKMYILQHQPDLQHEVKFANSCLGQKAKSFQVWEQKRFLAERHKDYKAELNSTDSILNSIDNKNYHAWSYRVWLVNAAQLHEQEMQFAQKMITSDIFNNSAWTYRYFLVEKILSKLPEEKRKDFIETEVENALLEVKGFKSNKASWNYLRGLFPSIRLNKISSKNTLKTTFAQSYSLFPFVLGTCLKWQQYIKDQLTLNKGQNVRLNLSWREILCTLVHIYSEKEETKQLARDCCELLAENDKQKVFYWKWVQKNL